jgi:exodeoxyribonuclease-3
MRIISVNVNGLRSASSKGFFEWLDQSGADIACLQETRILPHQIEAVHQPHGWHCEFFPAERPGYAGTAIYSRQKPDRVARGLGFALCDSEGRWIEAQYGDLTVASLYLPSGSASEEAQARKDIFLGEFLPRMRQWRAENRSLVVCGDWNIAHKQVDLKNWRGNQKNSGFLPHERAWLDTLFGEVGYVDAHRTLLAPDQAEYTWWSNRGRAWDNNVGWRIDYQVISPDLAGRLQAASVYRDQRFSDHAPLIIDYQN